MKSQKWLFLDFLFPIRHKGGAETKKGAIFIKNPDFPIEKTQKIM